MKENPSAQEQISRRKFSQLFCGPLLCLCAKDSAWNEDHWSSTDMLDILEHFNPTNVLKESDIQDLIQALGWSDKALFFKGPANNEEAVLVLPFIQNHVPMSQIVRCMQSSSQSTQSTVQQFYERYCANNTHPYTKITSTHLYSLYCTWCNVFRLPAATNKVFYKTLRTNHYIPQKGYCEGKCGVLYFVMQIDPMEVLLDVQKQEEEQDTQHYDQEKQDAKLVQDVIGGRTQIITTTSQGRADSISANQERSNVVADSFPNDTKYDTVNPNDNGNDSTADNTNEPVEFSENADGTDSDNFYQRLSTTNERFFETIPSNEHSHIQYPNDPTNIIGRLNNLPKGFRKTMDLARMDAKILSEPYTPEMFEDLVYGEGYTFEKDKLQELFKLLQEYVTANLNELRKGAIETREESL